MGESPPISAAVLQSLLAVSADGLGIVDPDSWKLAYTNPTLAALCGKITQTSTDRKLTDSIPELGSPAVRNQLDLLSSGESDEVAVAGHLTTGTGDDLPVDIRFRRVDQQCNSLLAFAIRPAVVATGFGETQPCHRTDPLTGLIDRELMMDRLATQLRGDRSGDQCFAVLFADIDNFKQVNDMYGHLFGDRVLHEAAQRLVACVRDNDHVARFGGDEFVVLLESVCGPSEIQPVVERIRVAFGRPIVTPRGQVNLTVSVGVAEASPGCGSAEDLIDAADRAMYATKRSSTSGAGD